LQRHDTVFLMLRWLLAGIGDIATKRVLPAILAEPRSVLAGVVTRSAAKAEPYGVPAWSDFGRALVESKPDLVYIATPVFLHAPQTIAALEAGAHVLCEKPMALNYGEAVTMQQAAERTGRTLGIAYYRRMYPKVERARELMAAGAIGQPVFAEATAHDWFFPADGFRQWLMDPQLAGGGPLRDTASHRIDLMNYLFGQPARAGGMMSALVHKAAVEDNVTLLLEFENGVRAVVDARRHSRVSRDEFRIRGTDGELDLSPLNEPALVYPGGVEQIPAHPNLHYPAVEDFVSAVLEGRQPRSNGATALLTEWVMEEVTPEPRRAGARTTATR
jgi:1,5-anhydro-D-fructose reductase (1,5-anhydro-D-mannitol-forming)